MRSDLPIAVVAVAAALTCVTPAQAVDQPTLDRINDSMTASYGTRLPIRYVPMPADRIAQLNWTEAEGYVVELDPGYLPDDVYRTCQTVAHEYTHWVRRDGEERDVAALPASRTDDDVKFVQHRNWPQDESQSYPPCRDLGAAVVWRHALEDRAWTLSEWLSSARPLSKKTCRTRKTKAARRACVRRVDAKLRNRRRVRAELRQIERRLRWA